MNRAYYAVRYRLNHKDRWLIWHTESASAGLEAGGVVIGQNGLVPVFRTRRSLTIYANANNLLPLEADNSAIYNFDAVEKWLKRKRPAKLDCVEFLNAWNLLADMSASMGGNFDSSQDNTRKVYSKLFWGNNLFAVTPIGKHYEPV